jgi:hypothetical protein
MTNAIVEILLFNFCISIFSPKYVFLEKKEKIDFLLDCSLCVLRLNSLANISQPKNTKKVIYLLKKEKKENI